MLKHYFLILLLLIPSNSSLSINYPHLKSNRNKINTNNHRPDISTSRYSSLTLLKTTGGDIEEPANRFNNLRRELFAEFIGTFLLVNIGCGTVCSATFNAAQTGIWQIAVVWSIAVTLAISVTASISGAHLNPAITMTQAMYRGFDWKKVIPYSLSQLFGSISAAAVNLALFSDSIKNFESLNGIIRGSANSIASAKAFGEYWSVSSWKTAFLAEAFGTGILAFVIFALTNKNNKTMSDNSNFIPPLIGATVGALISVIAPLTQAGFNPARDLGPRVISTTFGWGKIGMKGAWLYILAPLVGAPIGAFVADKILYPE